MPANATFDQALNEAINYAQLGRLEDAAEAWRRAVKLAPERPDVHYNLANALKNLGRNKEAIKAYRRCIKIDPGMTNAHFNLGGVLKSMDRLVDAAAAYQSAILCDQNDAEAHVNLGNVLELLGDSVAAEKYINRALFLDPASAIAHFNLANLLKKSCRSNEAESQYRQALAISPNLHKAYIGLGEIIKERGNLDDAIDCFNRAVKLDPNDATAHAYLATALQEALYLKDSEACCLRALDIDPNLPEVYCILGKVLMSLGRIQDAQNRFKQAIALKKDFFEAYSDLGNALTNLRDLDGALKSYQTAMKIDKWNGASHNYLLNLLHQPRLSNKELFKHYRAVVQSSKQPTLPTRLKKNIKKLHIGYVSSDFRVHPVGGNITPLLANHDHKRVEVFCYSQVMHKDRLTSILQKHANHWRDINALTDKDVAEVMRADGIHIAVFLGGHFDDNRPGIAAYRAAPVQIAMHGGTTTALDAMDYWLSDNVLHPEGEGDTAEKFTETIWRLPNFYNFTIPTDIPDVSPPPARGNGYVTFASFNKPCKMNDDVLDLWSGVLNAVPGSRLILKYQNHLSDAAVADPIRERFAANGITNDRIELIASIDNLNEHLTHYHQGDIALDTFPFSGATTTFQALCMGLPVVTLQGERFISRMGESICNHAGLDNLCAATPEDYIKVCASLAQNLEHLKELRLSLRDQVIKSPLCDGAAYAKNIEMAFQAMVVERIRIS
jgi:protein O-GlcNAc transferase